MKVRIWKVNVRMDDAYKRYFVEAKTRRGAIGNLRNILYQDVAVISASPVAD